MIRSASPASSPKSSLEEMLESLRRRDETLEMSKDLPPALPSRPTSRARLPSARRSLPMDLKVGGNWQLESQMETQASLPNENIKRKDMELGRKLGSFGSKKMRKDKKSVDSNPYVEENGEELHDSTMRSLTKVEEVDCDDNISYFTKKKLRVWCQLANGRWGSGKIQSTSGNEAVVSLSTGNTAKVSTEDLLPANPDILECTDDLIQLIYLNEPSILNNLKHRYLQDIIYSKAGPVLIAINPFKDVPIYGKEIATAYKNKQMDKPHVFAVADNAYNEMRRDGKNQSIIISGESGAGKTETAKRLMEYLRDLSGGFGGIDDALLQTSIILEAFGNAKTSINNNSSRFGKLLEIYFSTSGKIYGAKMQSFLLEKSRVVQLASGERSYHIFYQLCAGAPSTLRERLYLKKATEYNYLNQSECLIIDGVNDALKFHKLVGALDTIQISKQDQEQMFALLAAVLWIGNISFKEIKGENHVYVLSDEAVTNTARLMSCSANDLILALSTHRIQAGKEYVCKKLTLRQAIDRRDALAKFIYASLFDWLVEQTNKCLKGDKTNAGSSISLLDIYGFESFKTNSFEQFCINYANERLQQHFNRHLFKLKQEEYENDGIDWTKIDFQDNQECLDLFEKRPLGLLSLLDEESSFANASDLTFANKLKHHLHGNSCFKSQRGRAFGVSHYAGEVIYDTNGFLEKNRDPLPAEFVQLLSTSHSQLPKLFVKKMYDLSPKFSSTPGQFGGTESVGTKLKGQLFKLMNMLESTKPHFIRCIKPNSKQVPGVCDEDLVSRQLQCCGVLEVVRIAKSGYPTRVTHQEFAGRYRFLLSEKNPSSDPLSVTIALLKQFNIAPELYQVGLTKVHLRSGQIGKLEEESIRVLQGAVTIQKCFRGYRTRRSCVELKGASILRSVIRSESTIRQEGFSTKDHVASLRMTDEQIVAVTYLQSVIRGQLARKQTDSKLKTKQLTSESTNGRRKSFRKISEVKVIPLEQVDLQSSILMDLRKKIGKAEAFGSQKEEENAALKDQLKQFEKRWSDYQAQMKTMEESWQKQITSLQASLAAAKKSLASDNTPGQLGKLENFTSPRSYDSEENSGESSTPGGGITPRTVANGIPDGRETNATSAAVGNLTKEFELQKQNFDTDIKVLSEVKTRNSNTPPDDELRQLKLRFESWKKDYKVRLREMKQKLQKMGRAGGRRKWWGKCSPKQS